MSLNHTAAHKHGVRPGTRTLQAPLGFGDAVHTVRFILFARRSGRSVDRALRTDFTLKTAKVATIMSIKICLDPGHGHSNRKSGVYDPGAVAGGVTEAGIVLDWALTGKWLAKEYGIEVFLTRDDDSDPTPVGSRDDKAEAAGCNYFLSLHCNAANGQARGTETFYRDSADKAFAGIVQAAAMTAMGSKDRGLKSESDSQHTRLAVFDFDGPCALLEIGFIDSASDRTKMQQRETRIAFWRHLFMALKGQD